MGKAEGFIPFLGMLTEYLGSGIGEVTPTAGGPLVMIRVIYPLTQQGWRSDDPQSKGIEGSVPLQKD